MTDPMRHAESRNPIESMLRNIPGFKGYLEKEYRRDSDQLARTWLAEQLQKCKMSLDRWQRSLVDAGNIDAMPDCERLRSRLDLLQSRVKGAMRGYSGFFDLVRVDESLLDRVYQLDTGLMDEAAALRSAIEGLQSSTSAPRAALQQIGAQVDQFGLEFDKRNELLEGLN